MSEDQNLKKALEEAIDKSGISDQDMLDSAEILQNMQKIMNHCTPQDCALPQYNHAMTINGKADDFCSFFLRTPNKDDLSTFENRRLSVAEATFTRIGAMFVDYGLPYEENHDGLVLVVRRSQQKVLQQLVDDLEDAINRTGFPELDITYQPR